MDNVPTDHLRTGSVPAVRRRTFLSPDHQEAFERDGYVVVDLLDDQALDELQVAYESLDHRLHRDSPFAEGFHTTIYDQRPAYRAEVHRIVQRSFGPSLAGLLDDHQVFFSNFAVKMPRSASVPQHLDWTFVDEDRFTSATVWCPLVDTGSANGALGAVMGTHEGVDFVRPVNHRDYDRHAALVERSDGESVIPLRAGQGIVMDSRVVHFSPPNDSDHDRVVAAFVVAPREAELVHWWVGPDGLPTRHVVTPDFYLSYQIGEPPERFEGVLASTAVPGTPIG